ncbi:GNAT family N-acetyltransferase [Atopococcus tabaci]|uniref:GNAT family N-acetyltransferase n=1 Tax=Atopococcus tabaci TaxID=269774 RepID=UPI0003FC6821|nr:GNAT family N-acetyltransferase [Atopococcus tabaci]
MVQFVPIDEKNFEEVLQLKVNEHQSKFVAPNVRSLADCYLYRNNNDVFPYAIQKGETVVGFLLLDVDKENKEVMIWRMMIDRHHQGKGYGRQTVEKVIEWVKKENKYDVLVADYVKGNEVMGKLLRSLGFKDRSYNEEYDEFVLHYEC